MSVYLLRYILCLYKILSWADLEGGLRGLQPPPNGQSHSIKYSATDVPSHADAMIYIAKGLVVVVVMF